MTEDDRRAAEEITARRGKLAEEAVERQYRLEPEVWKSFGPEGRA